MRSEIRGSLMRWCATTALLPGRASRPSHSSGVCAAIAELVRRPNQARSWRKKWTCSQNLQVEFDGKNETGRNPQTRPLKWQASATSWAVWPTKGAAYLKLSSARFETPSNLSRFLRIQSPRISLKGAICLTPRIARGRVGYWFSTLPGRCCPRGKAVGVCLHQPAPERHSDFHHFPSGFDPQQRGSQPVCDRHSQIGGDR